MSQVRIFSRSMSVVVALALVVATTLMICGIAPGSPMARHAMPDSTACLTDSHHLLGVRPVSASPEIPAVSPVVLPTGIVVIVSRGAGLWGAMVSAELPPSPDPRHGKIRI